VYRTFKELILLLLKVFHESGEERAASNLFCEILHTLFQKPNKDIIEKENYRPVFLMNTDVKIFGKILANQVQWHIKNVVHCGLMEFIPGTQGWVNIKRVGYVIMVIVLCQFILRHGRASNSRSGSFMMIKKICIPKFVCFCLLKIFLVY
jgi:hypothetical protein